MALNVTGTGAYVVNTNNNSPVPVPTYSYFSGQITTTDTYAALNSGSPTVLIFGATFSEIILINNSANPFAFQWLENLGKSSDNGIVLANQTIPLRRAFKTGMLLRSATTGSPATALIWAV